MKGIKNFQKGIDTVATKKLEYEKIISHYDNAIENTKNDQIILQYNQSKENHNNIDDKNNKENELKEREAENKSKKNMLLKVKNKIIEKYNPIKHEFEIKTDLLYKKCDTIDKYKIELDYWIKQKNEIKETMQDYLFEVEQKKNELIQILSDKLKLSEIYKKSYKF